MVSRRLKLKPNRATESELERVRWQLTGLYNWAVRKLWADGRGGVFYSRFDFQKLINHHGAKCGLNQQTMDLVVTRAYRAHHRRANRSRPARLKTKRNRLRSIPIRTAIRWTDRTHIKVPGFPPLKIRPDSRFPAGQIKSGVIVQAARGWYLTLVVDGEANPLPTLAGDATAVGVDFGFLTLVTLSDGEKIANPREYHAIEARLGQASRGGNIRLANRLHQRLTNARRCRNHRISRDLLTRHHSLYLSRDNYRQLQRTFGKSVHSAGIGQLISMLHAKSRPGGRTIIEVSSRNSTRTCSDCGCLTGPAGRVGLRVREWTCSACGAHHDRDINAAVNTAKLGAMLAPESGHESRPETVEV